MTPLFISCFCAHCDDPPQSGLHRGYVVWRGPRGGVPEEYVFRTRRDAARWRALRGLQDCEIREVASSDAFSWQMSHGSVTDLELADQLWEIYPDHRFEPKPGRAFLA